MLGTHFQYASYVLLSSLLSLKEFFFYKNAGLYFNKAADSCDYSRNVLCNKKPKTTTTTTSTTTAQPKTAQSTTTPRTTTQRTRAPITAATSKTTLRQASSTTTTPIPDIYEVQKNFEENF